MSEQQIAAVEAYFLELQGRICAQLEDEDGSDRSFVVDSWKRNEGGGGCSRVLRDGLVFEQAGVNYSRVRGDKLPSAASALRPELAGRPFQALGISLVIHPRNPYVPSAHCNVRFFQAGGTDESRDGRGRAKQDARADESRDGRGKAKQAGIVPDNPLHSRHPWRSDARAETPSLRTFMNNPG